MFRSRTIRRRDRSNSTHARRLGVELMEGRMMLSASGLDVSSPGLDVTQSMFIPAEISFSGSYVSLETQPTDGGYVNSDAVTLRFNSIGQGTNEATLTLSGAGVSAQDRNVLPAF